MPISVVIFRAVCFDTSPKRKRGQTLLSLALRACIRITGVEYRYFVVACFLVGLCGCGSFGPKTLERTHGQYNEAVHEVEQEEFLRNIIRVRYNDSPSFLNVSSIAAQYELTSQAEARPFFVSPNPSNSNVIFKTFTSILPDVMVMNSNRPTLSLIPGDDGSATQQFFTPISIETLVFLSQAGWSTSTIMRVWVERLNGIPNADTLSNPPRGLVPDFARFLRIAELMQLAQDRQDGSMQVQERFEQVSGPLPATAMTAAAVVDAAKQGYEYRSPDEGKTWVLVRPGRRLVMQMKPGRETSPQILELESLLNLQPGKVHYEIMTTPEDFHDPLHAPTPPSQVVHLIPRSTAQVYHYISSGVHVPAEHAECGLAPVARDEQGAVFDITEVTRGLFEVQVAKGHKPQHAFVAVKYRGYWFYIDDRDQATKTTFGMVMQLSRLDFKKQQIGAGPFLTLPAGR